MDKNRIITRFKSKFCKKTIVLMITASLTLSFSHAETNLLRNSIYEKVGLQENVDPYLLYSISLVESAKANKKKDGTFVQPHKYAIRTPRGAIFPPTYFEAVHTLETELKRYNPKAIDIGLMQINGQHLSRVEKPEDLLNPGINVKVACDILKNAMDSYPSDKTIGIGRYHSFTDWRAKAYGSRVVAVYKNLKETK